MFRKMTGKPFKSFDETDQMVTRSLPIPTNTANGGGYIQFIATRNKHGLWEINARHTLEKSTSGFKLLMQALHSCLTKHYGRVPGKNEELKMNFDTAFYLLREMEEAVFKYHNLPAGEEPDRHFMQAWRLAPKEFRDGIEDIYQARLRKSDILPRKIQPAPDSPEAPAPKKPEGPKLN